MEVCLVPDDEGRVWKLGLLAFGSGGIAGFRGCCPRKGDEARMAVDRKGK